MRFEPLNVRWFTYVPDPWWVRRVLWAEDVCKRGKRPMTKGYLGVLNPCKGFAFKPSCFTVRLNKVAICPSLC